MATTIDRAQSEDLAQVLVRLDRHDPRSEFARISRDDVPGSVRQSVEFQSACRASAIVMPKPL